MQIRLATPWCSQNRSIGPSRAIDLCPTEAHEALAEADVRDLALGDPSVKGADGDPGSCGRSPRSCRGRPAFAVLKGVCDYGDSSKNDDWQGYAADAAASGAVSFILDHLRRDDLTVRPGVVARASSGENQPAPDLRGIRLALGEAFNLAELKVLVFDLGVDWDEIAGHGRSEKIAELLTFVRRRGLFDQLIDLVNRERAGILKAYDPSIGFDAGGSRSSTSLNPGSVVQASFAPENGTSSRFQEDRYTKVVALHAAMRRFGISLQSLTNPGGPSSLAPETLESFKEDFSRFQPMRLDAALFVSSETATLLERMALAASGAHSRRTQGDRTASVLTRRTRFP